jgi:hypothetical protein
MMIAYLAFCLYAYWFWPQHQKNLSNMDFVLEDSPIIQPTQKLDIHSEPGHIPKPKTRSNSRGSSRKLKLPTMPAISEDPELHLRSPPFKYSREQETCDAMQQLYGKSFTKARPSFLCNPETGRRLEIDCYNENLQVGAEFNGCQHYQYPNPFHRTLEQFHAQQRRDAYKQQICQQRGVQLFVVPDSIKKGQIHSYLTDQTQAHRDTIHAHAS